MILHRYTSSALDGNPLVKPPIETCRLGVYAIELFQGVGPSFDEDKNAKGKGKGGNKGKTSSSSSPSSSVNSSPKRMIKPSVKPNTSVNNATSKEATPRGEKLDKRPNQRNRK